MVVGIEVCLWIQTWMWTGLIAVLWSFTMLIVPWTPKTPFVVYDCLRNPLFELVIDPWCHPECQHEATKYIAFVLGILYVVLWEPKTYQKSQSIIGLICKDVLDLIWIIHLPHEYEGNWIIYSPFLVHWRHINKGICVGVNADVPGKMWGKRVHSMNPQNPQKWAHWTFF